MATPKSDHAAILQVIRALKKAGWNHVSITDPELVIVKGMNPTEIADLITNNYDSVALHFKKPAVENYRTQWIYFVLGNNPDEVVCDYTVSNGEFYDIVTTLIESW